MPRPTCRPSAMWCWPGSGWTWRWPRDAPPSEPTHQGKLGAMRYFFAYELPKIDALAGRGGQP
jgi:hypothetical protein